MSTTKKSKIWEKNLYDFLETEPTATDSEIKKAYRKKALKCHPDKNPDNPKAAELFHELSEALAILTDPKAKEAYDRTLKAKEQSKQRTRELDSKRRKLKEDLERREELAKEAAAAARSKAATFDPSVSDEEMLQKEIDRLKKEGSRALREEQELIRQQILKEQQGKSSYLDKITTTNHSSDFKTDKPRFKVNWSSIVLYDYDKLRNIFEKYGKVNELIVRKKSALVEFESQTDADNAFTSESGKSDFHWKFEWISRTSSTIPPKINTNTNSSETSAAKPVFSKPSVSIPPTSFEDFEAQILGQLSAAAAAQKDKTLSANSTADT